MQCNVGKIDRAIRGIAGTVIVGWGLLNNSILADVIGAVILLTAIIGWCPPYSLFGINTGCKSKTEE